MDAISLGFEERDLCISDGKGSEFQKHTPGRRSVPKIVSISSEMSPARATLSYDGDGSLMTIAPTGAGKGRSCIIPNLLTYAGQVVVIDPKGENYAITARARREMGQEVIKLDPFGITDGEGSFFNPLDFIRKNSNLDYDDAAVIANMIFKVTPGSRDPFWDRMALIILQSLLTFVNHESPQALRNLGEIHYLSYQSRTDWQMTVKEMMRSKHAAISRDVKIMEQAEPRVLASIISTLQAQLGFLGSPSVARSLNRTDIDLQGFVDGKPMTIYLIIPPEQLVAQSRTLRAWVGTLLALIFRRKTRPEISTLFILDEAAQLGHLEQLTQAVTLMRGYGLRTWSFWQDIKQLQHLYPTDWNVLVNNMHVLQSFGQLNPKARQDISGQFSNGFIQSEHMTDKAKQLLVLPDRGALLAQKLDYLKDPLCQGRFDPNPYFQAPSFRDADERRNERLPQAAIPERAKNVEENEVPWKSLAGAEEELFLTEADNGD